MPFSPPLFSGYFDGRISWLKHLAHFEIVVSIAPMPKIWWGFTKILRILGDRSPEVNRWCYAALHRIAT